MSTTDNIRPATHKDLRYILEIMNDAIENSTAIYDYQPKNQEYIIEWYQNKQKNNEPVFVYEENNTVVAYGSYTQFRPKEGYKHTVEHSVYVHPDHRSRGNGKSLLKKLIDFAQKSNIHSMIAGIDAENETSIYLHKSVGFTECGYIREAAYKYNRWLDLVFMQLILK